MFDFDSLTVGKCTVAAEYDTRRLETKITFYRPGPFGKKAFTKHKLRALTSGFWADQDADLVFTHTANADSEDAATVYCFRISTGELLWRVPDVPPDGIVLHEADRLLDVGKPYGIPDALYIVRLTYEGEVVTRHPASCYELSNAAEAAMKDGDYEKAEQEAVRAVKTEISPNTKAKMYRILGEIAEREGNRKSAIQYYEQAIEFNPKVGVKRQLAKLRNGGGQKGT